MNSAVLTAINDENSMELAASYAYRAVSAYCQRHNFGGCAHWLREESRDDPAALLDLHQQLGAGSPFGAGDR